MIPDETGPLDAHDDAVLTAVAELYAGADPVPADLVDRIRFAISLEDLDSEVMRLTGEVMVDAAMARSGPGEVDEVRSITFDCASLSIMISVTVADDDTVRIDGWLAPPGPHRVEVRTVAGPVSTVADEHGRFVAERIVRGLAQLVVRTAADGGQGAGRSVMTPSIVV